MKILEDRILIRRFKAGDSSAMQRIYEKYKLDLLKLAVVITYDVNTAEDAVHDVFLNFVKSIDRIEPRGKLKSYLSTSLVNRLRNIRRSAARKPTSALIDNDCAVSEKPRPQQWAILSEQLKSLSAAMAELPSEQREVIALRFEGKMSFNQIAAIQAVSANTVEGRYRYGIEKLRSLLNGELD